MRWYAVTKWLLKAPIHEATSLLKTVASNKIELQPKHQKQLPATRNNATLHHICGNIVAGNCCRQQSCLVYEGLK